MYTFTFLLYASLLQTAVYTFDKGFEFGSPQARRICQDLSASYDQPAGADFHGDPEGTNPDIFANITVWRLSDNLWNVTVLLEDFAQDSLAGWIGQVRPYGAGDLYTNHPVGVVEAVGSASEYWHCPDAAGVDNFTRNGVVHSNGEANKLVNLRSFSFTWASIPGLYPECARVVVSLMTTNDLWFQAFESECFMSVDMDGEIGRCEYPMCDPRDPGVPPARK